MSEATARFGFLGALGLATLGAAAAVVLGLNGQRWEAALFLVLALGALGASMALRRVYAARRAVRWQHELRQSQAALDALWQTTPPVAVPPIPPETELPHH